MEKSEVVAIVLSSLIGIICTSAEPEIIHRVQAGSIFALIIGIGVVMTLKKI